MKRYFLNSALVVMFSILLLSSSDLFAQDKKVRPSLKASVVQTLGTGTTVQFDYSRPGVKGRKIWGELVPMGMSPGNKYSKDKPYPWRAGANENTTMETSSDLLVEGKSLPAGKYGIHMIPSEKEWTIIFSKNSELWGSYAYNKDEDALRITVTPVKAAHQEWLTFGFEDLAGMTATAFLHWEELKVPFKLEAVEK